jgi:hypothetical protein
MNTAPQARLSIADLINGCARNLGPPPQGGESENGATLLDDIVTFLRRFVALSLAQSRACALWVLHSHAFDAAETTPYLNISSAEKQSGKTRLLEALELLVARPWLTARTSVAALIRKIAKDHATMLLDESDAAFQGDKTYVEALRGILNAGYRRGASATLCILDRRDIDTKDFDVFSAKAFAGIGDRLPDTIADRSIPIRLKRKMAGEKIERFRRREVVLVAKPLYERVERWAQSNADALRTARPGLPDELGDRAADVWEPLFAIADLAGGEWPIQARQDAIALSRSVDAEDQSTGVTLLADIKAIFAELGLDRIRSADLIVELCRRDESPWADFNKGKSINATQVARILKQYGFGPDKWRGDNGTERGYVLPKFKDSFERYLPTLGNAATAATAATESESRSESLAVVADESQGVAVQNGECGDYWGDAEADERELVAYVARVAPNPTLQGRSSSPVA